MAALGCIVALLVLTVAYIFPINAAFTKGPIALGDVPGRLDAWLAMHWVRIALALAVAGFGFFAVTH